jgi:hypothetical protein
MGKIKHRWTEMPYQSNNIHDAFWEIRGRNEKCKTPRAIHLKILYVICEERTFICEDIDKLEIRENR